MSGGIMYRLQDIGQCGLGPFQRSWGSSPVRPLSPILERQHSRGRCRAPGVRAAVPTPALAKQQDARRSAVDSIREFYDAQNAGDTEAIVALMADDVEYHDMVYSDPFQGKAEVARYFEKVAKIVPDYVKFVAEDMVGDERAVGVRWCVLSGAIDTWSMTRYLARCLARISDLNIAPDAMHVEIDGNEFPFSRGVSFYEMDGSGKILLARDIVEGTVKPGTAALQAIGVLAPLVRWLGPRASPKNLPAAAAWTFYAGYVGFVLLGTLAPGVPAYAVQVEDLQAIAHNSLNFFYVTPALCAAGISPVPCIAEHPVDEALFNFVNAYSLMLGPLMFADPRARNVKNKWPLWIGTMFLTNIFFIPFLALRAAPSAAATEEQEAMDVPAWAPAIGWVAAIVGGVSLAWCFASRPEYGGLEERLAFFASSVQSKRIFFAFVLDAVLYSVFQSMLMPKAAGHMRFVPFAGLAAWLITGAKGYNGTSAED